MFTHWYVLVQGDGFQYKRKEMFRPTSPHVVLLAGQILKDSNFKNTLWQRSNTFGPVKYENVVSDISN